VSEREVAYHTLERKSRDSVGGATDRKDATTSQTSKRVRERERIT
jgi:hypothetical protein